MIYGSESFHIVRGWDTCFQSAARTVKERYRWIDRALLEPVIREGDAEELSIEGKTDGSFVHIQ